VVAESVWVRYCALLHALASVDFLPDSGLNYFTSQGGYMKTKISIRQWVLIASTAALLTACGGAPSDNDIKEAIEKQMLGEQKAMNQIAGKQAADMFKDLVPEIKNAKKIGCKEDGEKAYRCDVELEVTRMGATNKGIVPIRFVKGSDGWMAQK
jgi:hypothetical protein